VSPRAAAPSSPEAEAVFSRGAARGRRGRAPARAEAAEAAEGGISRRCRCSRGEGDCNVGVRGGVLRRRRCRRIEGCHLGEARRRKLRMDRQGPRRCLRPGGGQGVDRGCRLGVPKRQRGRARPERVTGDAVLDYGRRHACANERGRPPAINAVQITDPLCAAPPGM